MSIDPDEFLTPEQYWAITASQRKRSLKWHIDLSLAPPLDLKRELENPASGTKFLTKASRPSMAQRYHDKFPRHYHTHCFYCGREVVHNHRGGYQESHHRTRDHVEPRSKGGKGQGNLVPACSKCNQRKRDMSLDEFRVLFTGDESGQFYGEKVEHEVKWGLTPDSVSIMEEQLCQETTKPLITRKRC